MVVTNRWAGRASEWTILDRSLEIRWSIRVLRVFLVALVICRIKFNDRKTSVHCAVMIDAGLRRLILHPQ